MPKKEKKIVQVSDDSKDTDDYTLDENRRIVKVEERKDPKGDAKKYRIGAIVCWILAIVMEVIAILRLTGKIDLFASMSIMAFLILFIVLDLVFFIPGSLLWKKANHIDPMSEKDKTKFWVWNNLGTILSVLAFLPIIIFVFTNKDLDGKQKGIVGAVAIVALLAAGITSYDFNPVSSEQLAEAQNEVKAVTGGVDKVYWAPHSKKYHVDPDCPAFSQSETVYEGTVAQAYEKNLTDPCRRCINSLDKQQEKAEKEVKSITGGIDKVYWAKSSDVYHTDSDCPALENSKEIYEGTVAQAYGQGKVVHCKKCAHEDGE